MEVFEDNSFGRVFVLFWFIRRVGFILWVLKMRILLVIEVLLIFFREFFWFFVWKEVIFFCFFEGNINFRGMVFLVFLGIILGFLLVMGGVRYFFLFGVINSFIWFLGFGFFLGGWVCLRNISDFFLKGFMSCEGFFDL